MELKIQGMYREGRGKGPARRLRAAGRIPAVAYGHGIESPIALSVEPRALGAALQNPKGLNALFTLEIEGGGSHQVLVREIQRHKVSRALLHVDLVAPDLEKPITAPVPVRVTGKSIGVSMGGKLRTPYREMKLLAKPADMPAEVVLDITELDQGQTIMASEVALPEGVSAVYDRDYVVVKVVAPRGRKATAEEAGKG